MEQMTGLAWLTGHETDQPHNQRGPCDPNAGLHAAFAFLAALRARDAGGSGHLVEVPMVETALNIAAESLLAWTAGGDLLGRMGNRSRWAVPQNVYRCSEDEAWLAIAVESDEQWAALVRAIGAPRWSLDPQLKTEAGRRARQDSIDERLAEWAACLDVADAAEVLASHGVPAAVVADGRLSSRHPQFIARGFFEAVEHPVVGTQLVAGLPMRFESVCRWFRTPAPTLGQHTPEVLSAILGLDEAQLNELEAAGVIGIRPVGT
jgi:crotonobetainyl-CoA:carnitine CoA-transferase CaiB-like acyl-CoA transferase